jgi:hypothetical protein
LNPAIYESETDGLTGIRYGKTKVAQPIASNATTACQPNPKQ